MNNTPFKQNNIRKTVLIIVLIVILFLIWLTHTTKFQFAPEELIIQYDLSGQNGTATVLFDYGDGFDEFNAIYEDIKSGSSTIKIKLPSKKIQRVKLTFDSVQNQSFKIQAIQLGSYFLIGEDLIQHFKGEEGTTLLIKQNDVILRSEKSSISIINEFIPLVETLENKTNFYRKMVIYAVLVLFYTLFYFSSRYLPCSTTINYISITKLAMIFLFMLFISLPLIEMKLDLFPDLNTKEKRDLAKEPDFKLESLSQFPHEYEQYFNDHFGLRSILVHSNNYLKTKILNSSPLSKLIVGKKGWLFYRSEEVSMGTTILDYRGLKPFSKKELDLIANNLTTMQKRLKGKNIYFVFVIVPNKETIYHDLLPDHIQPGQTRLDQLVNRIKSYPKLNILDLRESLFHKKKQDPQPLYYEGGTHWNQLGAYVGYDQIMNNLSNHFGDLSILTLQDFNIERNNASNHDHWLNFIENTFYQFRVKESAVEKKNPYKVLFFGDSFYEDIFESFIKSSFKQAIFQHHNWENLNYETIDKEKPDIVIYEIVERHLERILLY